MLSVGVLTRRRALIFIAAAAGSRPARRTISAFVSISVCVRVCARERACGLDRLVTIVTRSAAGRLRRHARLYVCPTRSEMSASRAELRSGHAASGAVPGGRTDRRRTAVRRAGRTATTNVRGVPDNAAAGLLLLLLLIVNCHRHITVTEHRSRTGDDHCHEAAARTSPVCHSCSCSPRSARHSDLPLPCPAARHCGPVSSRRFCPERTVTMNYSQIFNHRP